MEFKITPSQMVTEVTHCIQRGKVAYVTSAPGVGKSSIAQQIAKKGNLKLIDLRLSQCTPEDLQGFPKIVDGKATFVPFDVFPLESDPIPEGYSGWFLLLDELSSAPKSVQAPAYKLILDRMVGQHALHPACAIMAAGNRITDKAIVTQMSTALQSRLIHYELEVNSRDWMEHAIEYDFDYRVRGFIDYKPSALMNFNPDHSDKTFACPRTIEFLSDLVKDCPIDDSIGARAAGTVGSGTAIEFITFVKEYDRIPKLNDILNNPDTTSIPSESSTKFATLSMLVEKHTLDNLDKIITYMKRFDSEIQMVFIRNIASKNPKVREESKSFSDFMREMVRKYT